VFEHIDAVGVRQREGDVLLGEKQGDGGGLPQPFQRLRYLLEDDGASPSVGSSSINSFGFIISARAMVSICCSPPDKVPAACRCRSRKIGNNSNSQAICSALSAGGRCWPPRSRFSRTVMSVKSSRPSGHCTMPPRAIAAAVRRRSA
jgi:hypothetical protein